MLNAPGCSMDVVRMEGMGVGGRDKRGYVVGRWEGKRLHGRDGGVQSSR